MTSDSTSEVIRGYNKHRDFTQQFEGWSLIHTSRPPLEAGQGRGLNPTSEAVRSRGFNPTSKAVWGCLMPQSWIWPPRRDERSELTAGCLASSRRRLRIASSRLWGSRLATWLHSSQLLFRVLSSPHHTHDGIALSSQLWNRMMMFAHVQPIWKAAWRSHRRSRRQQLLQMLRKERHSLLG